MPPIKITHIITGLSVGGAENVLLRLLRNMDKNTFENRVISLTDMGPLAQHMVNDGIAVSAMNFLKGNVNFTPFAKLTTELRTNKPHLVQTWMYHADLIGGLAARLASCAPVMWNLRQSTLDKNHSKPSTITTANVCARLSSVLPNTIVCGSESARLVHTNLGYDATKMVVLHNGFDTQKFKSSSQQRTAFRVKYNIPEDAILIGNPSRYDRQKDHTTFLQAAARVIQEIPNAHFVLCGENITFSNKELSSAIQNLDLSKSIHLLGLLDDMSPFYSAIDILALSSAYGEGAPNVLGEAMSAQVPCVTTDVGDSAYIIGDTGIAVPPHTAKAFTKALIKFCKETPDQRLMRGKAARIRIENIFDLSTMSKRYEDLYKRVFSQKYDF
ncbi:MAG: glycosyltransferase [Magnetovibrio sp.]|nr:glycosyltransferase [Magnetovibrio sp.]